MRNEFTAAIESDLFSDAMDSAVTVYCTQGYIDRNSTDDGETRKRRQLAAAIRAFLENTPESDLVRLAKPSAIRPYGLRPSRVLLQPNIWSI